MQNIDDKSSKSDLTTEQYLEKLGEEKDLVQMGHYCQLANAKYMQMMS